MANAYLIKSRFIELRSDGTKFFSGHKTYGIVINYLDAVKVIQEKVRVMDGIPEENHHIELSQDFYRLTVSHPNGTDSVEYWADPWPILEPQT